MMVPDSTMPIRRLAHMHNGGTPTADAANWGGTIPWATPRDLGRVHGGYIDSTARTITETGSSSGAPVVPSGSIILSTRAPIGYIAITMERMAFNQGCRALVPRTSTVSSQYLSYALQSSTEKLRAAAQGTTFLELNGTSLADIRVPFLPYDQQQRIVNFLDRETAEIDAFIADQEQLIELLEERRTATITRAVTKGLDSNAPMKDSGVEWIGRVPESWSIKKIKWLSRVNRGASPRPIDDPKYFSEDGIWSWVRISDVTASDGRLRETTQKLSSLGASKSVKLNPGALFVSIAATVGKPCITEIQACIHDGFVYFPDLSQLLSLFLYRVFEGGQCYKGLGKLGTQLNLNTETIGSIKIPVPREDEILEILSMIDKEISVIDAAVSDAREAIGLSRERRAALISAAVTGQIDVTQQVG